MPTNTTTYSFQKPVVGADEDSWGGYLNSNWDKVDDLFDGTVAITGIDINSGTIDGTVIGGSSAAAGTFTTLTATTSATLQHSASTKLATTSTGVDITGTLTSDGLTIDGEGLAYFDLGSYSSTSANNAGLRIRSSASAASGNWAGITYQATSGDSTGTYWQQGITTNAGSYSSDFIVKGSTGASSMKERMRISSGGDISFYEDTGTTAKFVWKSADERLGIGTSSPTAPLHVYESGSGDGTIKIGNAQGGDTTNIGKQGSTAYGANSAGDAFVYTSTVNLSLMADGASSAIKFSTGGNTERMRIDSSGNVGIGTASPTRPLTVIDATSDGSGGILIQNYLPTLELDDASGGGTSTIIKHDGTDTIIENGGSQRIRIDASGNVLVGKSGSAFGTAGVEASATNGIWSTRSGFPPASFNRLTNDGDIAVFYKDGTTVGSIGVGNTNRPYIGGGDTGIMFDATNNAIYPWDTSTNNVPASDQVDLGYNATGLRFKDLHLSGGVYLGGTGAANKLDDYEEGTWTPVLKGGGASGTYELSDYSATYTKIGRVVYVSCSITLSSSITGGGTSYALISGLPFNYDVSEDKALTGNLRTTGVNYDSSATQINVVRESGADSGRVGFLETFPNAAAQFIQISDFSGSDTLNFTLTYHTTT